MSLVSNIAANIFRTGATTTPFEAAGRGRRGLGWMPTQLGINTLMYSHQDELVRRNRDTVRNNAWAAAAIDSYSSNAVARGIRLVPKHPDDKIRQAIANAWAIWVCQADQEFEVSNPASGQLDFHGMQNLVAREVMEAGEIFVRFRYRSASEGLIVPMQLQLIESEQLPIYRMDPSAVQGDNQVRCGIEYRPDGRRQAYHFWKAHPGETMFFPEDALQLDRVPAPEILHVYRLSRAGQMRGVPWMTSVLALLHSLSKYMDSETFRKEVASMITGFIKQVTPGDPILQADPNVTAWSPSEQISALEPGSFPVLNPGEEIQFAEVKDSGDFKAFIRTGLQAFASGVGLAEYQISGNLEGISYSSIRAGLLEFRRKCEQFQHSVMIHQFCMPVYKTWLKCAMINLVFGAAALNAYTKDPTPFEDVRWVTPGFPWVDPENEIKAFQAAVRDGFSSRTSVCASQGIDSEDIDREQAIENERADELGLAYDSDGRKVLTGMNAGLDQGDLRKQASHDQKMDKQAAQQQQQPQQGNTEKGNKK